MCAKRGPNRFLWYHAFYRLGCDDAQQGCQMAYVVSYQKFQFGHILEGPAKEDTDIFYGHLVYLTAIWYIIGHLVNFMVIWYIFAPFGMFTKKNLATLKLSVNKSAGN
jgi:hypothetical protein